MAMGTSNERRAFVSETFVWFSPQLTADRAKTEVNVEMSLEKFFMFFLAMMVLKFFAPPSREEEGACRYSRFYDLHLIGSK